MTGRIDWDDPATARYYEAFCTAHPRYREANAALVAHARIVPGQCLLDLAAGTGRTAEAALPLLGGGVIHCVEPAAAMRAAGAARLDDARIAWRADLPGLSGAFDRILCGAAMWLLLPLAETFDRMHTLLAPHGALVFNVPALYLGVADPPGSGGDPFLADIPARLATAGSGNAAPPADPLPAPAELDALLRDAGFRTERWEFETEISQAAMRDWLKIPVMTNELLRGLDADERARRIDDAWTTSSQASRKREAWLGWTCWRR